MRKLRSSVWLLSFLLVASCGGDLGYDVREATYVGASSCGACHEAEFAAWTGSHHDLAMQEATPEAVLGDFNGATFTHRGLTSTFSTRDGQFFVHTEGPDGGLQEYPIAYTFGAAPLQQYLVAFPGGRYQVLGIAWDSRLEPEGGQRWFHLYPDADTGPESPLHWTRPAQNWNTTCAECHSTNLTKGFDFASESFETTWSEIDVSCEACHGPASTHVALAQEAEGSGGGEAVGDWGFSVRMTTQGRSWGAEPGASTATLRGAVKSDEQIDTCARCHARRAMISEAPLPGEPVHEYGLVSLIREDLYHADGQILEEVYVYGSFAQSKMYAAGVTCSDCHEPHSLRAKLEGNALCTQCHQAGQFDAQSHHFHAPESAGAQCVECHMPETTYMVVDPRRDHSIRIPRPDLTESIGAPNACNRCHADQSARWAAGAVARWYETERPSHYGEALHAARSGDPDALQPLIDLAADVAQPGIVRATALSLMGRYAHSSVAVAVQAGLGDPDPWVKLGALEASGGVSAPAILPFVYPLLGDSSAAVRLQSVRLLAALPQAAVAPQQSVAIDQALREYEQAQMVNADHPSAWVNLGDLYGARGQTGAAEVAYRNALDVDSTDLVARLNLADLQRALGRDDVGERLLFEALEIDPTAAEVLHAIGLLRVRGGEAAEALDWLERASLSRPENARFAYVYGVALASADRTRDGVRALEGALAAHPYDRDLLSALVTYSRDLGEVSVAIAYAERLVEVLPEDDAARALLQRLRGSGG